MNILVIGGGGREHALCRKLADSPLAGEIFCAPGNAGIARLAHCVDLDVTDHRAAIDFCRKHEIGLVVVGPEAPLCAGIVDDLDAAGIKAFGPTAAAARLEGSKGFTKDLCASHGIPTAEFARFDNVAEALDHVRAQPLPVVVKADGLAAGKGVVVAATREDAEDAVRHLGSDGGEIVIEECLVGREASFFALVDGRTVLPLAGAEDHKRVGDGDTGPNTGGMGAFSPSLLLDAAMSARVLREIVEPTVAAMARAGTPFRGVLYAGLMLTAGGPKLIEYNVRFGDPECQVLTMRLDSDLLPLMLATVEGRLDRVAPPVWSGDAALTVVMASRGYPGAYETGSEIRGLDAASALPGVEIFHAGTRAGNGRILAAGGRVLNVTARGADLAEARGRAYAAVDRIDWPQGFCRRDIGLRIDARQDRDRPARPT